MAKRLVRVGAARRLISCSLAVTLTLVATLAAAQARPSDEARASAPSSGKSRSMFTPSRDPNRPRSIFWMPLASFVVPGLDQWIEGQPVAAAAYTGAALGGLIYADTISRENGLYEKERREREEAKARKASGDDDEAQTGLDEKDDVKRKVMLGGLVTQGAGGMSAYHSFRTAVRSRKGLGEYDFLVHEETPGDIFAAPLQFGFLARPTTFIPLAIGAGLAALILNSEPPEEIERTSFTQADAFFTAAYSLNAGTHEEAMFRGWLMPVFHEKGMSPFLANGTQSLMFAFAHLGTNSLPIPQLLLGFHLGYVTQENDWRMGEAVFIHVWWDVLAFATQYHYREKAPEEAKALITPILWAPPLEWHF